MTIGVRDCFVAHPAPRNDGGWGAPRDDRPGRASRDGVSSLVLAAVFLCLLVPTLAMAGEWVESKPVMYRGEIAMTYRARLAGEWLIVEAKHSPAWHSYAMDNVERARKATGKQTPETELPTRIAVTGGLKTVGAWKQTAPKDLSKADIQWYSWGFEGTARFAVKVERVADGGEAVITVNAQSCNASSCSMVRDLKIVLPVTAEPSTEDSTGVEEGLVKVGADAASDGEAFPKQ